jgi:hypothetical protein
MTIDLWFYPSVIFLSLISLLFAYVKISIHDQSWLNCLTVPLGFVILTAYLFETIRIVGSGHAGYSVLALLFCYSLAPAYYWGLTYAYTHVRTIPLGMRHGVPSNARLIAYLLLLSAWVIFLPILISFAKYASNPREIYVHIKETQLGSFYFMSSALARLGLITFLIVPARKWLETLLFCTAAIANVVMHGSQGQMVSLIAIGIFMSVYVARKQAPFWAIILMAAVAAAFVVASAFLLFRVGSNQQALTTIASYSDYVSNSAALIDRNYLPHFGWITMEDNILSHLPRILLPEKPKMFGLLSISAQVRPYAASLGYYPGFLYGEECADFGLFAPMAVLIEGFFAGLVMRSCRETLAQDRNLFAAVVFLYFCGGNLINLGLGSTFIDQVLLVTAVQLAASVRMFAPPSSERTTPADVATTGLP